MIKVLTVYTDSATGETMRLDLTLPGDTPNLPDLIKGIQDAFVEDGISVIEPWVPIHWHELKDHQVFAFIAECPKAAYFGAYLVHGMVYTNFI